MQISKTIAPLLWRAIVFVCVFVAVSGLAGSRIISGGIIAVDGFGVYGGLGKALLFAGVAFVLLLLRQQRRAATTSPTMLPWRLPLLLWAAASVGTFVAAWVGIGALLRGNNGVLEIITVHAGLLLCLVFALLACFGLRNLQRVWRAYRREICLSLALGAVFYVFLLAVYALWSVLASLVLGGVRALLSFSGLHVVLLPSHTLMLDKFSITVAKYCSGIESIALFTGLYVVVGLLDWQRLRKQRYLVVFPIALLVLFLLNIVRIFGLIIAGYYINPKIAFSLFHTYAGLLFFILYSAAFWLIAYKYLLKPEPKLPGKKSTITDQMKRKDGSR